MKKTLYVLAALVIFDCALFGVNSFNGWRGIKPALASVSKSAASTSASAEQKIYRVTFRVAPVVQSQAKSQ